MRALLILSALAMPAISVVAQRGVFGRTNDVISREYPTLLIAAGYAFAVWGLIFLLDVIYAALATQRPTHMLKRVAPAAAFGFTMTATWMPVFSLELFELSVFVIVAALAGVLWPTRVLAQIEKRTREESIAFYALSLHSGWLSLAVFLNIAQLMVFHNIPGALVWSLTLFSAVGVLLLGASVQMGGNLPYAAVAVWGLVAVFVKQRSHDIVGSDIAAWVAIALAAALIVLNSVLLWRRKERATMSTCLRKLDFGAPRGVPHA